MGSRQPEWRDGDDWAEEARTHMEQGRLREAEQALREALTRDPERPEWHFHLGRLLEHADRNDEAREAYLRCHELDPDAPEPLLAAAGVTAENGDREASLRLVERAVTLDRTRDESHAQRIELLSELDRFEDAQSAFYEAQEFVETPVHSLMSMANALVRNDQMPRAEWCLREVLRLDPSEIDARKMLAKALMHRGDHAKALHNFLQALREDPTDTSALIGCASALARLDRHAEAMEKLNRVIELEPANVHAHRLLGGLETAAGRLERAAAQFELVLKLDPSRPERIIDLADLQLRRGRAAEARAAIRTLLAELPEEALDPAASEEDRLSPLDHARAATVACATESWPEARLLLEPMAILLPDQPDVWRGLARARYEVGDIDGGIAASERALAIDPRCAISHHNLTLAALRLGALGTAWQRVNRGLRANRTDEGLRRLRVRVAIARVGAMLRRITPAGWRRAGAP